MGVEEENGTVKYPVKGIETNSIDSILKILREYCHFIEPVAEPVEFDGVYVIVVWISGGFGRHYKAPENVTQPHSIL